MEYFPPRDLVGYGNKPPHVTWPKGERIAISFVLNYEEGAEVSPCNGDRFSETLLSDTVGVPKYEKRNMSIESLYEYGSRCGVYRIFEEFRKRKLPLTLYACGLALEKNPSVVSYLKNVDWEVASHGWRWIDYTMVDEKTEREDIEKCVSLHKELFGKPPKGFYQGKPSENTRKLVVENGNFLYDNDSYCEELPYWTYDFGSKPHLIIPYTLDNNDMKFCCPQGFQTSVEFYSYLKDAFDVLYEEGSETPKMMSIGLHCRIIGRPGRIRGLQKFLDYITSKKDIWICKREDIYDHWLEHHPPRD